MSDRDITLDDFWRGRADLASLAAQLLTERDDAGDSIWRRDPYGSALVELLERGASPTLIQREIERVLELTDRGGVIESVTERGAELRALDVRISITADAVTSED